MEKKYYSRRLAATGLITAIALGPATQALALSYTSTLDYTVSVTGPNRNFFNATDISVSGTYKQSRDGASTTHRVELYRNRFGRDDYVGEATLPRAGTATKKWSNTGPGTYRLRFVKTNDGVRITSSNVEIFDQKG